jgi:hypothetical protein
MVITNNTSVNVAREIREALKNINMNPFATAGLHEDDLYAEDEILMQISDETKRVTLDDISGYLNVNAGGSSRYTATSLLGILSDQFEEDADGKVKIDDEVLSGGGTNPTVDNVHPLFSSEQFQIDGDEIKLIDADYQIDTTYTPGEGIEINNENVINCTVTGVENGVVDLRTTGAPPILRFQVFSGDAVRESTKLYLDTFFEDIFAIDRDVELTEQNQQLKYDCHKTLSYKCMSIRLI